VKDVVTSPIFNLNDCIELFNDYSRTSGVKVVKEVVEDIYERTKGHAGLVCFCGKQIAEILAQGKTCISLEDWIQFAYYDLPLRLPLGWSTIGKLVSLLKKEPSYREFLMKKFLYNNRESVVLTNQEDRQLAMTLSAEGALELTNREDPLGFSFSIPCTLLRSILLSLYSRAKSIWLQIPLINGTDRLNVPQALALGLPYFNRAVMCDAASMSHKQNCAPDAEAGLKDQVPSENCYHVELMFLLRAWLPQWNIFSEANVDNRYCDLILQTANGTRCLIELVAHQPDKSKAEKDNSVLGHVKRVQRSCMRQLKVDDAWVVNFTTRQPTDTTGLGYIRPSSRSPVKLVHVYHDLKWTCAKISADQNPESVVTVNLKHGPSYVSCNLTSITDFHRDPTSETHTY